MTDVLLIASAAFIFALLAYAVIAAFRSRGR